MAQQSTRGAVPRLAIGDVLAGRFELRAEIGSGGFGMVYKAHDVVADRVVALKVLREDLDAATTAAAIRNELSPAFRINHPARAALGFGTTPSGGTFLLLEYVDGPSLADVLAREGRLDVARAAEILVPVCELLAEAHANDVVHRDLKPSHILLDESGETTRVKVIDFGIAELAKPVGGDGPGGNRIVGTPEYMAPERFEGKRATAMSDVYSFGVILYEALTGRVPFEREPGDPRSVALRHLQETPPPPRQLRPDLPAELEELILKTLEKQSPRRPEADWVAYRLAWIARHLGHDTGGLPGPAVVGPQSAEATTILLAELPDDEDDD